MPELVRSWATGRLLPLFANGLWLLACRKNHKAFGKATHNVEHVQRSILLDILRKNEQSEYGKKYNFSQIRDIRDYLAQVPITSYDDYVPYIDRLAGGTLKVLTEEKVSMLEPTGGSTRGAKLIPYTPSLKSQFQKGIAPWVFDLFSRHSGLLAGKAYWSITPAGGRRVKTPGGVPVGFEDDSEYFGALEKRLLAGLMAVPKEAAQIEDMESFRYITLLCLLREKYLTFISVWNPTFLILLLKPLKGWAESLTDDIRHGTVTPPGSLSPGLFKKFKAPPLNHRAREVAAILHRQDTRGCGKDLWPRLKLISCWADAGAAAYIRDVEAWFPDVFIQPKGLLATEGIVSFPLEKGCALALTSHFYEFLDSSGQIRLAHQLEINQTYSVLLTTGGGFYRYRLNDLIKVTGMKGQCPMVRFLGKEEGYSDLFGEKLAETHVRKVVEGRAAELCIRLKFYLLAPEKTDQNVFYTLFVEPEEAGDAAKLSSLLEGIEAGLRENYHYAYCQQLGQLGRLRVFWIYDGGWESYLQGCLAKGQRLGDIKPLSMHKDFGWSQNFGGRFI